MLPNFAVADAIIALHANRTAERELRVLQVLKLRGSGFRTGEHAVPHRRGRLRRVSSSRLTSTT